MKKIFSLFAVLALGITLVACGPKEEPVVEDDEATNVKLTAAINFDGSRFISSNKPTFTALNGTEVKQGELHVTWREIGKNLDITFDDYGYKTKAKNTNEQFEGLKANGFKDVHLVNSTGAAITQEAILSNSFVDLMPFINQGKMPNLKKFLDSNPQFLSNMKAEDGGLYYTPYLDGLNEIENMFLIRHDWTKTVIDGTATGDTFAIPADKAGLYTKNGPATLNTKIAVTRNGAKTEITKKYDANIIDVLNAIVDPTGAKYLAAFRTHMQSTYGQQSYAKLSDVFLGTDAAYDADELVALMRVVKYNPSLFNANRAEAKQFDKDNLPEVFFPRENKGNRVRNMFRSLEMFGVRGALSKHQWLYQDSEGKLSDSRYEADTKTAINSLNKLYKEGLITENFGEQTGGKDVNWVNTLLKDADGFLIYDYNATQTATGVVDAAKKVDKDYQLEAILPPVNDWKGDGKWFHFTESVRLLKNEAWGITTQATGSQLARAVRLLDYLYDNDGSKFNGKDIEAGAPLHLYGPKEYRSTQKTFEYVNAQGTKEMIYKLSPAAITQMNELSGGNMINYLRDFVGATLPVGHVRSLGLEVQTLSPQGLAGFERLNAAVKAGTFKLQGLSDMNDKWFHTVPNVFPLTYSESQLLVNPMKDFTTYWNDNALKNMIYNGLEGDRLDAYNNLFSYEGNNWYTDLYIPSYTKALNRNK